MYHQSEDEGRRKAWTAAKPAVRAYTKDPSELNAMKVKAAWLNVRELRDCAVAL